MKKHFLTILAAIIVVDIIAMTIWYTNKKKNPTEPAPQAVEMTPMNAPPETAAVAEPSQASTLPPASEAPGAPPEAMNYGSSLYGHGISPGGCASLMACEEFCLRPENEAECLAWTQSDQKKKRDKRENTDSFDPMLPAVMAEEVEITPGDCIGTACASYCKKMSNRDECVDYCSRPKNHKTCQKWGKVPAAIKDAMDGDLVSSDAVVDSATFGIIPD